jgi:hypothetical protein
MWKLIWNTNVPPKIKVFGWKLATNSLGVQDHCCKRNMDILPTCSICGMEPETAHHAMTNCTKAIALRNKLKEDWELPTEKSLRYSGQDWVLILLSQSCPDMRVKLLFMWWRIWHLWNNIIFGDGKCTIKHSANFIKSYYSSFSQAASTNHKTDNRGKKPIEVLNDDAPNRHKENTERWKKPEVGWTKLNVDASFIHDEKVGAWGAVLRDKEGEVCCQLGEISPTVIQLILQRPQLAYKV